MQVEFLGHSCFYLIGENKKKIITDPYDETVGYKVPDKKADILLCSHDHFDHNNVKAVQGNPVVINTAGTHTVEDMTFRALEMDHDEVGGIKRGKTLVFIWEMEDLRLCFLGDLGNIPTQRQVDEIGPVEVVFIPVGGVFTLDGMGAKKTFRMMNPKLVIPMHFVTAKLNPRKFAQVEPLSKFLVGEPSRKQFDPVVHLDKGSLPYTRYEVWVMTQTH